MKLLLDQNLSHRILRALSEHFPGSTHVRNLKLHAATDEQIWRYTRDNDFIVVTRDADFVERYLLEGAPPRIVWLNCGNTSTAHIENLLLRNVERISAMETNTAAGFLVLA